MGISLYCLTNFSAETYPPTFERFEFLRWFRGVLVSGEVGVIKPDPRIFELLLKRFAIDPQPAVYIDDVAVNVDAARPFGIHAIHFTTPTTLRAELAELGLIPLAIHVTFAMRTTAVSIEIREASVSYGAHGGSRPRIESSRPALTSFTGHI